MQRQDGFTLIELLVVMGIIAVLMGLLIPGIRMARTSARKNQTQAIISRLSLALENYSNDFGDYPPSNLKDLGLPSNRVNDGIESLVACLSTGRRSGPYFDFEDEFLVNRDKDKVPDFNQSAFKGLLGFEYTDPWGNPYIYFHNRDYERPQVASVYRFAEKKRVQAAPGKSGKKGTFHGFDSFQLWSAGPDGKNNNGEGDDIPSW